MYLYVLVCIFLDFVEMKGQSHATCFARLASRDTFVRHLDLELYCHVHHEARGHIADTAAINIGVTSPLKNNMQRMRQSIASHPTDHMKGKYVSRWRNIRPVLYLCSSINFFHVIVIKLYRLQGSPVDLLAA